MDEQPCLTGNPLCFNSHQLLHYDFYNLVHLVKICFQQSSPHYHVRSTITLAAIRKSASRHGWVRTAPKSLFTDLTQENFRCCLGMFIYIKPRNSLKIVKTVFSVNLNFIQQFVSDPTLKGFWLKWRNIFRLRVIQNFSTSSYWVTGFKTPHRTSEVVKT